MSNPTILITGKNGQLGSELQELAPKFHQFSFIYNDYDELDIANEEAVADFFNTNKIDYCINAAAYTAVDKAETEQAIALRVNAEAVGVLARNCKHHNARFIHISTDYVFNGEATSPYKENAVTDPVNFYGRTKLDGELLATKEDPSSIIIRTAWVYSKYGNNFVKTMLRLMSERESISVVGDQVGSPTYAADLAETLLKIIASLHNKEVDANGIFHYSNEGIISWFEFATAIKELSGSKCIVNSIPTSAYPTPAKRPNYSAFDKEKIAKTFNIELKDWKGSLERCLEKLQQKS